MADHRLLDVTLTPPARWASLVTGGSVPAAALDQVRGLAAGFPDFRVDRVRRGADGVVRVECHVGCSVAVDVVRWLPFAQAGWMVRSAPVEGMGVRVVAQEHGLVSYEPV